MVIEYENEENTIVSNHSHASVGTPSLDTTVGGLHTAKDTLIDIIQSALFQYTQFAQFNIRPPRGVLLYLREHGLINRYGPPGSGKTLLVRSLVKVYKLSFFSVNIASLLSKYLGESEKQLTQLFLQAKQSCPAIIFLDEIDALCPPREYASTQTARLCSLLLSLFDDLNEQVLVIGATNR